MADGPGGKNVGRLSLKVLPDTSDFLDELKAFAERVEREVRIELDVLLDIESAKQELAALQAKLESADLTVDIATELDGAGALAHLEILLAAMQGTASMNPIEVDLDIDGQAGAAAAAVASATAQGAANASRMGTQIALWGPLILIAAVGIAALAPALLVLFPLMAGLALGVGAFAAGWKDVKEVFKPIIDGFKEMRAEIGQTLTAGLRPLVAEFVSGFMPVLKDGLTVGAQLMNTMLKSILGFLSSTEGIALMSELFKGLGPALEPLAQAMGPLVELFVRLSVAALPGLQMMSEAILQVITDLNGWLGVNDISDEISTSMSQLGDVFTIIGKLAADLWGPLVAAAPAVIAFLGGIGEALGTMFQVLQPVFTFMSEHTGTMGLLGAVLTVVAVGIGLVSAAMAILNMVMAVNPWALLVIGIAAVVAGLIYAYTHFEGFRNVVNSVFTFVRTIVTTVVAFVLEHWRFFAAALITIFTGPIGLLVALVVSNFGAIRSFVVSVFNAVVGFLRGALDKIVAFFTGGFNAARAVVATVITAIKAVIQTQINAAMAILRGISAVAGFFSSAFNAVKTTVSTAISNVVKTVTGLPGKVKSGLGNLSGDLVGAGMDLVRGLINGIEKMAGQAVSAAKGVVGGAIKGAKNLLGINSPSTVFAEFGRFTIMGFVEGMESQYDTVEKSLAVFTTGLGDLATFDGEAALKFSGTSGVLPQLDALMSLDGGSAATRLVIENWDTGIGHMRNIAEDTVSGYEAATVARTPPGEETP